MLLERKALAFVAALTIVSSLAACERPADREPSPAAAVEEPPPAPADPAMQRTAECVDRVEGYAVAYPADWHVARSEAFGPCSFFHPDPVEIPPASEVPVDIAITIGFEPVDFATLTADDVLGRRDLAREPTTVDGREALRIESESTGEGLHDRGLRSYRYFVDLGDTTMVAATHDAGDLPFDRKRRILDAMMGSFDFREPGG